MTKEELINEIEKAFQAEEYPGDSQLVIDNTGYDLKCHQVREAFKGKPWDKLHANFLLDEKDSIHFFSKKGFKYYLPAFMIVSIEKFHEMNALPDTTVGKLTLPMGVDTVLLVDVIHRILSDKQSDIDLYDILQDQLQKNNKSIRNFFDYMSDFNREQSIAICHFLEFMTQHSGGLIYNPQTAIDRYWFQFSRDTV